MSHTDEYFWQLLPRIKSFTFLTVGEGDWPGALFRGWSCLSHVGVGGPAGPFSGPHPRVSLSEAPARTTDWWHHQSGTTTLPSPSRESTANLASATFSVVAKVLRCPSPAFWEDRGFEGRGGDVTCPGLLREASALQPSTAGQGGVARAQAKHPVPGLSPAALALRHPTHPGSDPPIHPTVP